MAFKSRPPGIRRSSKESKVPNKRERKSFRVYVEVSRAQHPASKPELEADGFGESKAISKPMAFKSRPPGIRRSSKESKVPNKRERKSFRVYVEVSRAQHPASKPELEADGFGESKAISKPMAFKSRPPGIRRSSKESKVPNKRERKSFRVYVEVSRAQHPASKPELEADGFGESKAISKPMAFKSRPPGIRRSSKESKVPNKRERKSFRVYVEVSRAQHPASKPELEADGFGESKAISKPMAFKSRPPGIRRSSKESKVPNKRERKSFRVYVEIAK